MSIPSPDSPATSELIWNLLHFFSQPGIRQLVLLKDYGEDLRRRGVPPHMEHPLAELAEGFEKSLGLLHAENEIPEAVFEIVQEIAREISVMFSSQIADFTSEEAILSKKEWREIRNLASKALLLRPLGADPKQVSVDYLLCYFAD